ncbi:MAG: metallophosphatase [Chitinophagales bacterium]|nr:metallophosphatase [Bacteroidota bacterium]MCB9042875.1 metallophosphatase [Chitinophagales bacterium]
MSSRRNFIEKSLWLAAGASMHTLLPFPVWASDSRTVRLTILHTNDVHSRLEPFPADAGKYAGLGGAARRAAIVQQIRQTHENVLLFDSGDILQGTPYFNMYHGKPEFEIMNAMAYDAATIGNHDFDSGMENLAHLTDLANFPMLSANYDFRGTPMVQKTLPYTIFEKNDLKIGVFGIGIALEGLVPPKLFGKTQYLNPIEKANEIAVHLKTEKNCDLVICLSHLGFEYDTDKTSDKLLAAASSHIDIILGGHTHTFLEKAYVAKNKEGKPTLINQVGWAGIWLGKLDISFEKRRKKLTIIDANAPIR